eukprot:CAMPEP_0173379678 /NCGR_PEP_ID=MMETSP1356-20130122/2525_1 /TAXON_ID=77927 ORGANISM="Hemiselmis virescens, Strain PCC157" /NCGR_SAMPLE_ID=MMETSP1356 /ASSEMBLY_ACC=CAM_ASM_000847 /LENGTH=165 /DNA_ID=CAMNT_0014333053 /DNA_START=244 /DNA_END=738 /DNA_ORIENTATION=-
MIWHRSGEDCDGGMSSDCCERRGMNGNELSLSRGNSFDGVTCRCGRGCSSSLSNFAFSMELDDCLDIDKCFGSHESSLALDDRSLQFASPLTAVQRENQTAFSGGRNCETGGGNKNTGEPVSQQKATQKASTGGQRDDNNSEWWSTWDSTLRGSLSRRKAALGWG